MKMILCLLFCSLIATAAEASPTASSTTAIDLNTAPAGALVDLPGIGEKRARQIVELRKKKPFTRIEELRKVKGVGRKTLEKLRPRVTIVPVAQPVKLAKAAKKKARAISDSWKE
jgi:competence ComEA-like helix-hairpin-helix protein